MSFSTIEYLVAERPETPETLTIDSHGNARYASHTNLGAPDRPEIGTYAMTLSASDLEAVAALADPSFKDVPDHWGKVRPGDLSRRIRVTSGGATVEKLVGTKLPVDANLRMATATLDRIIKATLDHPVATLRIELSQAAVDPRAGLSALLSFNNRGTDPTLFRSPFDLLPGENGWLTVELWPDKPASDIASEDVVRATVTKVELVDPTDPAIPTRQGLTLASKATMSFRVRAKLEKPKAGPSLVRLAYASFAGPQGALVGEVLSQPAKVDVPREAAR